MSDSLSGSHVAARPSRILFFPLGWVLAHTVRCIEIAKVLRQRGHEVIFAGDDPNHPSSRLNLVQEAGFPLLYAREPSLPDIWSRFQRLGWKASFWDMVHLRYWAPLTKIIESQLQAIEQVKPDLVVGDATVSASTAAYIAGVPCAGIMNGYAARLLTPPTPTYYAAKGLDRYLLSGIRRRLYQKYQRPDRNAFDMLYHMPMISPDLPGLYSLPKRFRDYHMVGPISPDLTAPLPEWFDELQDGTPNIYITMGSTGLLEHFLRSTYPTLGALPYRFMVTTGGQVSEEVMDAAPSNFRFTRYAPGSQLLAHARAMLYHGGNGSMYQSLAAGVPMLALPAHYEQRLNAQIGVRQKFGLQMSARRINPNKLVRQLERLMHEPVFRQSAQRFSSAVQKANGAANAADILERALGRR